MNRHKPNILGRIVTRIVRGIKRRVMPSPDAFLRKLKGVIHIGANLGQEREQYERLGLSVLWIEPIPEVFNILQSNIADFPRQRALQYLVTDTDGKEYTFNIASNFGASSSIFELDLHKKVYPEIWFTGSVVLQSITLATLLTKEGINIAEYDGLVLDTQGSELLILIGAGDRLENFSYIKTEVSDFSAYSDCCVMSEVDEYLCNRNFKRVNTHRFETKPGVGSCYDVVYKNNLR